jgi:hypothetical protein
LHLFHDGTFVTGHAAADGRVQAGFIKDVARHGRLLLRVWGGNVARAYLMGDACRLCDVR